MRRVIVRCGCLQRVGDNVRINVQLVDAGDDVNIWAESYDRQLTAQNIFAIQSEISEAIAIALETTLTPAEQIRSAAKPKLRMSMRPSLDSVG